MIRLYWVGEECKHKHAHMYGDCPGELAGCFRTFDDALSRAKKSVEGRGYLFEIHPCRGGVNVHVSHMVGDYVYSAHIARIVVD